MSLVGHILHPSQIFHDVLQPIHNVNAGISQFGHRVANTGHQISSGIGDLLDLVPLLLVGGVVLFALNMSR